MSTTQPPSPRDHLRAYLVARVRDLLSRGMIHGSLPFEEIVKRVTMEVARDIREDAENVLKEVGLGIAGAGIKVVGQFLMDFANKLGTK